MNDDLTFAAYKEIEFRIRHPWRHLARSIHAAIVRIPLPLSALFKQTILAPFGR